MIAFNKSIKKLIYKIYPNPIIFTGFTDPQITCFNTHKILRHRKQALCSFFCQLYQGRQLQMLLFFFVLIDTAFQIKSICLPLLLALLPSAINNLHICISLLIFYKAMESWHRMLVAACIGIALMKIFGNKGILITLGVIVIVLFLVFYFQNSLLYMPNIPNTAHSPKDNPAGYRHPSEQGLPCEQVSITTSDNVNIRGWLIKNENNKRLIVYFHENAGNLGFRIPFAKNIYQRTHSDVLMVAYRGYSDSQGVPTEEGIQKDAIAVMEYAVNYKNRAELQGQHKSIYLLGRSLGGAVCAYLTEFGGFTKEIQGLILQNTFTSIQEMVKVIFPVLSFVQFLHRNFWATIDRIGEIQNPILFIKSLKDELVPPSQMQILIDAAKKCRLKEQHDIPNGTHNVAWEMDPRGYFGKMNEFFQKVEQ